MALTRESRKEVQAERIKQRRTAVRVPAALDYCMVRAIDILHSGHQLTNEVKERGSSSSLVYVARFSSLHSKCVRRTASEVRRQRIVRGPHSMRLADERAVFWALIIARFDSKLIVVLDDMEVSADAQRVGAQEISRKFLHSH